MSHNPQYQDPGKVLLAVVVGFAAGMLFAPRSGEETRAMLRERREEAKWRMRNAKQELKRQSSETSEQLKSVAESVRPRSRRSKNNEENESDKS